MAWLTEDGWPALRFSEITTTVGAPSLRFLQGREAMRHDRRPSRPTFVVPALRKLREERDTHFVADAGEIKSMGHPPPEFRTSSA